ncbi:hypothetical protein [Polaribacter glomeratus]|uniref:Uncharacterized protein n=1 Tax=Polaribacter glomeratus TaxID=102 RepID=A0A2S7WGE6_9FLAO|nr:hypothetical protein [Polaribacter glomeratus]PQJ76680.1 hypothetical protein BTO16_12400 [Polaribacter glomeratus]TXD67480.1 hypothetical protein ESX12_02515 [Polaribacter glomeratus]
MKIKGLFVKNLLEFIDCEIFIEYGVFQRLIFNSRTFKNYHNPKNKSEFEIKRVSSLPLYFIPAKHNFEFTYLGVNDENQRVFLKLNIFKLFLIKWNLKKYLIQSESIKTDILKYIIGGIIGFLTTLFVQKISQYIKDPEIPPITESIKSFEVKYIVADFNLFNNESIIN